MSTVSSSTNQGDVFGRARARVQGLAERLKRKDRPPLTAADRQSMMTLTPVQKSDIARREGHAPEYYEGGG